MTNQPSPWCTANEAAERLRVSPRTFHRYVAAGRVKKYKLAGAVRYKLAEVDRIPKKD